MSLIILSFLLMIPSVASLQTKLIVVLLFFPLFDASNKFQPPLRWSSLSVNNKSFAWRRSVSNHTFPIQRCFFKNLSSQFNNTVRITISTIKDNIISVSPNSHMIVIAFSIALSNSFRSPDLVGHKYSNQSIILEAKFKGLGQFFSIVFQMLTIIHNVWKYGQYFPHH